MKEEKERDVDALRRVEPVLYVTMMMLKLMKNGMHYITKVPWSQVQVKNGKAVFQAEEVDYELRRNKYNLRDYTGH